MTKDHYQGLLQLCNSIPAIPTAVVHPCDRVALEGAIDAAQLRLIEPILVGPEHKIKATAEEFSIDISGFAIESVEHSHAAAQRGVELVREGRAAMLMKGSLHSDELLSAVVRSSTGLRTARRISHVFAMNVPSYHKPLFITDAAVNISPNLDDKADICRNAIDLLHVLGIDRPKVAILSAVETVTLKLTSTLEAAALIVMSHRKQIKGAILDGPLAFDNAINAQAASIKGIESEVAGDPDILLAPDLEAGNMLAKQLIYLASSQAAGLVLGARVPIVLTSRSDPAPARIASCVLCVLLANAQQKKTAQAIIKN